MEGLRRAALSAATYGDLLYAARAGWKELRQLLDAAPRPAELPKLDAKASGPIRYPVADFFLTNAICRNSPTMRRCSEELVYGAAIQEAAE